MTDTITDLMMRYTLRLGGDRVILDTENHRVDVSLSHSREDLVCLETDETGTLYDHRRERVWRHLEWF